MSRIVGVDVGGTFTDLACFDTATGAFAVAKVPSNRGDEAVGFLEGLSAFGAIADLDADVTSIEAARSRMEVVPELGRSGFGRGIGPGVYDIHSPRIPTGGEMIDLLEKARAVLAPEQIWVNPDCGLKTRGWPEVREALERMVEAARVLRGGAAQAA